MSIKEKIDQYFSGYLHEDINNNEKRRLADILNNESNKSEIDACFYKVWNEVEEHVDKKTIENSFAKLKGELDIPTDSTPLKKQNNNRIEVLTNIFKYAAIIVIAFSIGLLTKNQLQIKNSAGEVAFNEFAVPYGSKSELLLPDGTKIWVNSGSKIKYPINFTKTNREVYLDGEAYFDVKKDPSNPFLVKTSDVLIRVLGTSFNVKSYPDEKAIETTLVTGSLEILKNSNVSDNKVAIKLEPNQKANFSKETGKVTLFKQESLSEGTENISQQPMLAKLAPIPTEFVEKYTAWKDQKLVFIDNTFDELIKKMERWYGVEMIIESSDMNNGTFNGIFEKETLEQALDALRLATPKPFDYSIEKNVVKISSTN